MTVTRRTVIKSVGAAALLASGGLAKTARPVPSGNKKIPRPNIVVILVDDMGFSDIGTYGSEIPTPNIDALASNGLRFTQFYNTPRCSCSRASLLTGAYPHQAGLGHLEEVVVPGSRGLHGKLEDRVVTFAETLGEAGYYTGIAGKWHLGISHGVGPWHRGFRRSLVSANGEVYFPGQPQEKARTLYLDGQKLPSDSPIIGTGDWYSSDLFVEWASKFASEAQERHEPFLIYLPFVAVHFPLMARPEDIEKFRGRYNENWDDLRAARLERQKAMHIVGAKQRLPPRLPNTYNWEKLDAEERDRFDEIMAIYAADVAGMDRAIGTLIENLRNQGVLDDTLILFMSDNGGSAESGPDGMLIGDSPGDAESIVLCGMNWASLENTPFQWFKHFTYEGGIATPFIAHWPKGIDPSLRGTLVHEPSHLVDVMSTLLDVSGAQHPAVYHGNNIIPVQGRSLAPAFQGKALHRTVPLFWEHEGNRAIRDGNWKLVARFNKPWELYDLSEDRSELEDLAKEYPERVSKMAKLWEAWAAVSYVDKWDESFEGKHKRNRQNWGSWEVPRLPQASDRIEND